MNNKIFIAVVAVFIIVGGALYYKSNQTTCDATSGQCNVKQQKESKMESNNQLTAQKVVEQVKANKAVLIDVREQFEYDASHAEAAILHPLGDINTETIAKYRKYDHIYLYCRSGARASDAKRIFQENDFENVTNIGGLMMDWVALGGQIVK